MSKRVWVIGPVAIDRVAYLESIPHQGSFTRPSRIVERIGGSSANIALALSEAGVETGFISYIGDDSHGEKIERYFKASKIAHLYLQHINGESNNALVIVDSDGERTIIALTESHLAEISLESINFKADDIVVFSLWRPFFINHLLHVQKIGCTTVVGIEALLDPAVPKADFAIGSEAELGSAQPIDHLDRFPTIVITRGSAGVDQYRSQEAIHLNAHEGPVVDTTGAGDSFMAGYLLHLASDTSDLRQGLDFGLRWAAASVAMEGSAPAPPPV